MKGPHNFQLKLAADRMADRDLLVFAGGVAQAAEENAAGLATDCRITAAELTALGGAINK
jgi:hypothetical protein